MNLFNTICAWIAIICVAVTVISLLILIWVMPIWTVAKSALTGLIAAIVFGIMATAPIW